MQHTPVKRNYALDAVKVLATTLILFHHHQQVAEVAFPGCFNFYYNMHFYWGMMVELFFMISGFFAYRALVKTESSFGVFFFRKINRLLPVTAVSTGVCCMLSYLHFVTQGKPWFFNEIPDFFGLIVSALGMQISFGFDGAQLNNPIWFISVLLMCYICFYLIGYWTKKYHWRLEWAMLIVIIATQNLFESKNVIPFLGTDSLRGYQSFALGVLLGGFVATYKIHKPLAVVCVLVLAACIMFFVFAPAYINVPDAFVFLVCPMIILLAQTDAAQKLFRHGFWGILSAISFNVYVWHFTLQALLALVLPQIAFSRTVGGMLLFTLIAWFAGTLSHYFIERPLNNHLPKVWKWLFVRQ